MGQEYAIVKMLRISSKILKAKNSVLRKKKIYLQTVARELPFTKKVGILQIIQNYLPMPHRFHFYEVFRLWGNIVMGLVWLFMSTKTSHTFKWEAN